MADQPGYLSQSRKVWLIACGAGVRAWRRVLASAEESRMQASSFDIRHTSSRFHPREAQDALINGKVMPFFLDLYIQNV